MERLLVWLPVIIIIVFPILIILSLSDDGMVNECGQGYHWEEDFRQTVGGCVHD